MSKPSSQKGKPTAKAGETYKKKWPIIITIGVTFVILIVVILYFAWPKPESVTKKSALVTKLEVTDLVIGTGKEAKTGDTLFVEYIGWVYGKDRKDFFDRSANHDTAFAFVLGKEEAIKGFDQGLVGMKVGGQRALTIPSDLAYGERGALKGKIPPNAALVFEVELLDVISPLVELPPTTVTKLKVEDLIVGTGATANTGNSLTVHYTGWLEDGTQFDSSLGGPPLDFALGYGEVIVGWDMGLVNMKVGGTRKLIIPPDLAYGKTGAKTIPPNAALIFEVILLAVK